MSCCCFCSCSSSSLFVRESHVLVLLLCCTHVRPSCVASENDTTALSVPHVVQFLFEFLHSSCLSPSACLRAPGRVSLSCRFPPLFTHAVRLYSMLLMLYCVCIWPWGWAAASCAPRRRYPRSSATVPRASARCELKCMQLYVDTAWLQLASFARLIARLP